MTAGAAAPSESGARFDVAPAAIAVPKPKAATRTTRNGLGRKRRRGRWRLDIIVTCLIGVTGRAYATRGGGLPGSRLARSGMQDGKQKQSRHNLPLRTVRKPELCASVPRTSLTTS